jgi:hypothetical protein
MKSFKLFIENVQIFTLNLQESSGKDFKQRSIEKQQEIKSKQEKLRSDYQERMSAQRKSTKNKHHGSLIVGLVKLGAKAALDSAKKRAKKALKRKKS